MSIDSISTTPPGDDVPHIADPGNDAIDPQPNPGQDVLDTITHIRSHGASRSVTEQPTWTGRGKGVPDIDAALSGLTPATGVRDVRDEAVQVRQLLPTQWDVHAVAIAANPSQIAVRRAERITMQVFNNGPSTLYIGPTREKTSIFTGFPLAVGATLILNNLAEMWGASDPATGGGLPADVRIVETWRTDNPGN